MVARTQKSYHRAKGNAIQSSVHELVFICFFSGDFSFEKCKEYISWQTEKNGNTRQANMRNHARPTRRRYVYTTHTLHWQYITLIRQEWHRVCASFRHNFGVLCCEQHISFHLSDRLQWRCHANDTRWDESTCTRRVSAQMAIKYANLRSPPARNHHPTTYLLRSNLRAAICEGTRMFVRATACVFTLLMCFACMFTAPVRSGRISPVAGLSSVHSADA